ncbi:proteasome regulatory particle subunit [Malassezia caprae]|uniref:Proteasome regulatory particle subunit n=1 Tax=Malassezia caprae TaxID=1381934 RepID=A0AAF0E675_9BASI|nr:proteasome regulatory particle subunit [Malassezia caprae]
MDDDAVAPIPNPAVQQQLFVLARQGSSEAQRSEALAKLLENIEKDDMAPYYEFLLADPAIATHVPRNESMIESIRVKNVAELERLDAARKQAEENDGDLELHTVLKQRAMYLARIGDKEAALPAIEEAVEKAQGTGTKIDLTLLKIRLGLFYGDTDLTESSMTKAATLIEEGGDWDRRNRLTAYRGVYCASIRHFGESSKLLKEALSTFTATELIEYNDFVQLTILMGMVTLSRRELKQLMESPEVLQIIDELPHLREYTSSLYNSEYATFFRALAMIEQVYLLPSRIVSRHTQFYVREMRIIAFSQLLESYRSVALDRMAQAFGVTTEYMDRELSRFISTGRLAAVIDKVEGVIENRRPDQKNAQYSRIIKEGDVLLSTCLY